MSGAAAPPLLLLLLLLLLLRSGGAAAQCLSFVDPVVKGHSSIPSHAADGVYEVPTPFSYRYRAESYSSIIMGTNGVASPTSGAMSNGQNTNSPLEISALWRNWGTGGTLYYGPTMQGTVNVFVLTWYGVIAEGGGGTATFQLQIYEGSLTIPMSKMAIVVHVDEDHQGTIGFQDPRGDNNDYLLLFDAPAGPDVTYSIDGNSDGYDDCADACPSDPDKVTPGSCGCGVPDTDTDGDTTPDCQDSCPSDPAKTYPGTCGCGTPDTDTDGDQTLDCNDGCPNDAFKLAPGVCGCNTPDTDADADQTPDCQDGCPSDPGKVAPGLCGCGTTDTDRDADQTPDCEDGCPDDPGKVAAGVCGCGTADTDTDGDQTPDCQDGCPSDPSKVYSGECGCGTPDVDTDGDTYPNCQDGCPSDPAKSYPGTCGCGTADTDTDGDQTPDCNDGCMNDPLKVAPGVCGCNSPETDTDGDQTPDCQDGCPSDPGKVAPGACGCFTPETDRDADQTPDCQDSCPDDPGKVAPGVCGCGTADTDTDGDQSPDCTDGCPSDPLKVAPGACGCNTSETDTDGDQTPDCVDGCPSDPVKASPGICGCGTPDTDSDNDETSDCLDGCPNDPLKVAPGECGCGTPETNTDGDAKPDCTDGCPNDPLKVAPGACGCFTPETDMDGDQTPDCTDGCPNDPLKVAPGACGCYNPETDTDGDQTPDCTDGCPSDPGKATPGVCGCGTPDTDSDGDETSDCQDGCPSDPAKSYPGECGCGTPDTDSDRDGTPDCRDGCPADISKTAKGVCGCFTPDTDSDSDGASDCVDQCPSSALKTAPGQCGCNTPDTDADGDQTPDCTDGCPSDPGKTAPGDCGCGTPDTNSDGDARPDCTDGCPTDPNKVAPGNCGCGVAETPGDSDMDGTLDCRDGCPSDANKTAVGQCGCGTADTDSDGDARPDCIDGCRLDGGKTAPGTCGCGTADTDSDTDGAADCVDGCAFDAAHSVRGVCGCGVGDIDSDRDGAMDCDDECPQSSAKRVADADGCVAATLSGLVAQCTAPDIRGFGTLYGKRSSVPGRFVTAWNETLLVSLGTYSSSFVSLRVGNVSNGAGALSVVEAPLPTSLDFVGLALANDGRASLVSVQNESAAQLAVYVLYRSSGEGGWQMLCALRYELRIARWFADASLSSTESPPCWEVSGAFELVRDLTAASDDAVFAVVRVSTAATGGGPNEVVSGAGAKASSHAGRAVVRPSLAVAVVALRTKPGASAALDMGDGFEATALAYRVQQQLVWVAAQTSVALVVRSLNLENNRVGEAVLVQHAGDAAPSAMVLSAAHSALWGCFADAAGSVTCVSAVLEAHVDGGESTLRVLKQQVWHDQLSSTHCSRTLISVSAPRVRKFGYLELCGADLGLRMLSASSSSSSGSGSTGTAAVLGSRVRVQNLTATTPITPSPTEMSVHASDATDAASALLFVLVDSATRATLQVLSFCSWYGETLEQAAARTVVTRYGGHAPEPSVLLLVGSSLLQQLARFEGQSLVVDARGEECGNCALSGSMVNDSAIMLSLQHSVPIGTYMILLAAYDGNATRSITPSPLRLEFVLYAGRPSAQHSQLVVVAPPSGTPLRVGFNASLLLTLFDTLGNRIYDDDSVTASMFRVTNLRLVRMIARGNGTVEVVVSAQQHAPWQFVFVTADNSSRTLSGDAWSADRASSAASVARLQTLPVVVQHSRVTVVCVVRNLFGEVLQGDTTQVDVIFAPDYGQYEGSSPSSSAGWRTDAADVRRPRVKTSGDAIELRAVFVGNGTYSTSLLMSEIGEWTVEVLVDRSTVGAARSVSVQPVYVSALFTESLAGVQIVLNTPVVSESATDCTLLWKSSIVGVLGSGPRCFTGDSLGVVLNVEFGRDATLLPGHSLALQQTALEGVEAVVNITVLLPAAYARPRASVQGPSQVSACAPLVLDGSVSGSAASGARALSFVWSVRSSNSTQALIAAATASGAAGGVGSSAGPAGYVVVQSGSSSSYVLQPLTLPGGAVLDVALQTRNFLGNVSDTSTVTVQVLGDVTPTLLIRGSPEVTIRQSQALRLAAQLTFYSSCGGALNGSGAADNGTWASRLNITASSFAWRQVSGPSFAAHLVSGWNRSMLVGASRAFTELGFYVFAVTVHVTRDGASSSALEASVVLRVRGDPFNVRIAGGSRFVAFSQPLSLAAFILGGSNDSFVYEWTCANFSRAAGQPGALADFSVLEMADRALLSSPCTGFPQRFALSSNNASIATAAGYTFEDVLVFGVRARRVGGVTVVFHAVQITVVGSGDIPVVSISPLSMLMPSRNERVILDTVVGGSRSNVSVLWTNVAGGYPLGVRSSIRTTVDSRTLILAPGYLVAGAWYTFQVTLTNARSKLSASASIRFQCKPLISGGVTSLVDETLRSIANGGRVLLGAKVALQFESWTSSVDDVLPLQYAVGVLTSTQLLSGLAFDGTVALDNVPGDAYLQLTDFSASSTPSFSFVAPPGTDLLAASEANRRVVVAGLIRDALGYVTVTPLPSVVAQVPNVTGNGVAVDGASTAQLGLLAVARSAAAASSSELSVFEQPEASRISVLESTLAMNTLSSGLDANTSLWSAIKTLRNGVIGTLLDVSRSGAFGDAEKASVMISSYESAMGSPKQVTSSNVLRVMGSTNTLLLGSSTTSAPRNATSQGSAALLSRVVEFLDVPARGVKQAALLSNTSTSGSVVVDDASSIADNLVNLTRLTATSVSQSLICNEDPVRLKSSRLNVEAAKSSIGKMLAEQMNSGEAISGSFVGARTMDSDAGSAGDTLKANGDVGCLQTQFAVYEGNIYAWSNSSAWLSSSVVSVEVQNESQPINSSLVVDGIVLRIETQNKTALSEEVGASLNLKPPAAVLNTSQPAAVPSGLDFTFTSGADDLVCVDFVVENGTHGRCLHFEGVTSVCSFFDTARGAFSTEGCVAVESTPGVTTCRCSHLTAFGVLLPPNNVDLFVRGLPLLTANNFAIIVILVILAVLFVLVLLVARLCYCCDTWNTLLELLANMRCLRISKRDRHSKTLSTQLRVQVVDGLQESHDLLSIFSRRRLRGLTRDHRIVILFSSVLGAMALNAAFYGRGGNFGHWVLASIFTGLILVAFMLLSIVLLSQAEGYAQRHLELRNRVVDSQYEFVRRLRLMTSKSKSRNELGSLGHDSPVVSESATSLAADSGSPGASKQAIGATHREEQRLLLDPAVEAAASERAVRHTLPDRNVVVPLMKSLSPRELFFVFRPQLLWFIKSLPFLFVIGFSGACVYFLLLFGLTFGNDTTESWFWSNIGWFVLDSVVLQPLKIVLLSSAITAIARRCGCRSCTRGSEAATGADGVATGALAETTSSAAAPADASAAGDGLRQVDEAPIRLGSYPVDAAEVKRAVHEHFDILMEKSDYPLFDGVDSMALLMPHDLQTRCRSLSDALAKGDWERASAEAWNALQASTVLRADAARARGGEAASGSARTYGPAWSALFGYVRCKALLMGAGTATQCKEACASMLTEMEGALGDPDVQLKSALSLLLELTALTHMVAFVISEGVDEAVRAVISDVDRCLGTPSVDWLVRGRLCHLLAVVLEASGLFHAAYNRAVRALAIVQSSWLAQAHDGLGRRKGGLVKHFVGLDVSQWPDAYRYAATLCQRAHSNDVAMFVAIIARDAARFSRETGLQGVFTCFLGDLYHASGDVQTAQLVYRDTVELAEYSSSMLLMEVAMSRYSEACADLREPQKGLEFLANKEAAVLRSSSPALVATLHLLRAFLYLEAGGAAPRSVGVAWLASAEKPPAAAEATASAAAVKKAILLPEIERAAEEASRACELFAQARSSLLLVGLRVVATARALLDGGRVLHDSPLPAELLQALARIMPLSGGERDKTERERGAAGAPAAAAGRANVAEDAGGDGGSGSGGGNIGSSSGSDAAVLLPDDEAICRLAAWLQLSLARQRSGDAAGAEAFAMQGLRLQFRRESDVAYVLWLRIARQALQATMNGGDVNASRALIAAVGRASRTELGAARMVAVRARLEQERGRDTDAVQCYTDSIGQLDVFLASAPAARDARAGGEARALHVADWVGAARQLRFELSQRLAQLVLRDVASRGAAACGAQTHGTDLLVRSLTCLCKGVAVVGAHTLESALLRLQLAELFTRVDRTSTRDATCLLLLSVLDDVRPPGSGDRDPDARASASSLQASPSAARSADARRSRMFAMLLLSYEAREPAHRFAWAAQALREADYPHCNVERLHVQCVASVLQLGDGRMALQLLDAAPEEALSSNVLLSVRVLRVLCLDKSGQRAEAVAELRDVADVLRSNGDLGELRVVLCYAVALHKRSPGAADAAARDEAGELAELLSTSRDVPPADLAAAWPAAGDVIRHFESAAFGHLFDSGLAGAAERARHEHEHEHEQPASAGAAIAREAAAMAAELFPTAQRDGEREPERVALFDLSEIIDWSDRHTVRAFVGLLGSPERDGASALERVHSADSQLEPGAAASSSHESAFRDWFAELDRREAFAGQLDLGEWLAHEGITP